MSSYTYPVFGLTFGRHGGNTFTSGLSLSQQTADNSVERAKFTVTDNEWGQLELNVVRNEGRHVSVSHMVATGSLGANLTSTERKLFHPDAWTIYSVAGEAVGATDGTTDTDVTPSGVGTA